VQQCGQPNAFSLNHVCAFCIRWRPRSRGKRRKVHARRYRETKCSCRLNKLHLLSLRASTNHRRPDFDRRSGQMVPDLAHSKGQRRRNAADVSWRRRKGEMERTDCLETGTENRWRVVLCGRDSKVVEEPMHAGRAPS